MRKVVVKGLEIGSGRPKICVPLVGKTKAEILAAAKQFLTEPCELVEWRVDFYEEVYDYQKVIEIADELQKILVNKPLLFTFRSQKEGGERPLEEVAYYALNDALIRSGKIDLVDLEYFMSEEPISQLLDLAKEHQVLTILCNHDFEQTPPKDEIINRLRGMQDRGGDICKIAVMPKDSTDVLTLLAATNEMQKKYGDRPIITMSMGDLGMVSRLSGEIFGSAITFGAVGKVSAPGQIPVKKLVDFLENISLIR